MLRGSWFITDDKTGEFHGTADRRFAELCKTVQNVDKIMKRYLSDP
jgi:hypothetical protein